MKGKECKQGMKTSIWKLKLNIDRQKKKTHVPWLHQCSGLKVSWGGYSDTLNFVNFSVIHNQMIDTNGLWNLKTTDITFFLAKADELKQ